ncbi:MAG: hypothetical protein P8074_22380, partial [Anaerolineales bacterium]
MKETALPRARATVSPYRIGQIVIGVIAIAFVAWRLYIVLVQGNYGPDTWLRFAISGLIIGAVYSVIAIGYTLVYGILFMINFAHGEIMMIGAFSGYFVFEALNTASTGGSSTANFLNTYPVISIILAFLAGMTVSTVGGIMLERIAYRPLRGAPRLVPLISAIGASIFLQNAAQLMFGPGRRNYTNPDLLARGSGLTVVINDSPVIITYTGIFTFI